jgi:peptidyl-dipeptidase Dcp
MGTPAFDKMQVADVKPAMLKAMELNLSEIEAIATNPEPPTFENTIVAMERSGKVLDRAFTYYGIFSSNMSSPEFREVQTELAPLFSEFQSKITQNEQLFQRIKIVYEASKTKPLEADQQRVVELTYQGFAMNGR